MDTADLHRRLSTTNLTADEKHRIVDLLHRQATHITALEAVHTAAGQLHNALGPVYSTGDAGAHAYHALSHALAAVRSLTYGDPA